MERPNLFNDAPKELSQDGYLSWLLSWSDPGYREVDIALHECGVSFVRLLVSKQLPELAASLEIGSIVVARQWNRIDVTALINGELRIIIEDKVGSRAGTDQLDRYKGLSLVDRGGESDKLVCIFLKTENYVSEERTYAVEHGYAPVTRKDLLDFFASYTTDNAIFNDYRDHLQFIEDQTNAYARLPIVSWSDNVYSWQGLFSLLESSMPVEFRSGWDYVSNPQGGFWCFWWNDHEWKGYRVYFQLNHKEGTLCFMVKAADKSRAERTAIRNQWSKHVLSHAAAKGLPVHRPHFGNGGSMQVAVVRREDWLGEENSVIDKDRMLSTLRSYDDFLSECIKNN
jgi:hypothetical protein